MHHRSWASGLGVLFLVGCAGTPPAPVAVPLATPTAVAPAAAPASGAEAADLAAHQKLVREARAAGFTVSSPQPGSYLYCTYGAATGSRVAAKTCFSEVQMQGWLARQEQTKDDLQRTLSCGGSGCADRSPK